MTSGRGRVLPLSIRVGSAFDRSHPGEAGCAEWSTLSRAPDVQIGIYLIDRKVERLRNQ